MDMQWLSINDKGEVCEMIGIEACLKQDEIDDYNLQDVSDNHNPRFPCSYLETNKKGFKVDIRTQFLTPSIRYTVNLVVRKGNPFGKQMYVGLRYKLEGDTETSIVYLAIETKNYRTFIAELYQFTSNGRTFDLDIVFEDHKVDLKVEGILFQPLEKVELEISKISRALP
ncbi:hypothetical protein Tco_1422441 [Tanacetum coccineum]